MSETPEPVLKEAPGESAPPPAPSKRRLRRAALLFFFLYALASGIAMLIPLKGLRERLQTELAPSPEWSVEIGAVHADLWLGPALVLKDIRLLKREPRAQLEVLHVRKMRVHWPLLRLLRLQRAVAVRVDGPALLLAFAFADKAPSPADPELLRYANWRTVRAALEALLSLGHRGKQETRGFWASFGIDSVYVRDASVRAILTSLLAEESFPLVLDGFRGGFALPAVDDPGTLWFEGDVSVGPERRHVLAGGEVLLRRGGEKEEWFLPSFEAHLADAVLRARFLSSKPLETLEADGDDEPANNAGGPRIGGEGEGAAELSLSVEDPESSLAPLWMPLVAPGFPWKVQGGFDLSLRRESSGEEERSELKIDLTRSGVLRGGWFEKAPGVPVRLTVRTRREGPLGEVLPSELDLAGLSVRFSGRFDPEEARAADLVFKGEASDLSGFLGLAGDFPLAATDPSGLVLQGVARVSAMSAPVLDLRIDEASLYSGGSDLHAAGAARLGIEPRLDFEFLSDRFAPSDWIAAAEPFPLAGFLRVPLEQLRGRFQMDLAGLSLTGAQAKWAGGDFLLRAAYSLLLCKGEGAFAVAGARLGPLARFAGAKDVEPGLAGGELSLEGEAGRDLPCTGGSPGPLSAWGANLSFQVKGLEVPLLSDQKEGDLPILEKLTG
ncbi:MAG: hypothetical protein AB1405_14510, partial [Bdellovibrionota bacterium]